MVGWISLKYRLWTETLKNFDLTCGLQSLECGLLELINFRNKRNSVQWLAQPLRASNYITNGLCRTTGILCTFLRTFHHVNLHWIICVNYCPDYKLATIPFHLHLRYKIWGYHCSENLDYGLQDHVSMYSC